jgi:hypothetical protein
MVTAINAAAMMMEKIKTRALCELAPELAPDYQGAGVNGGGGEVKRCR